MSPSVMIDNLSDFATSAPPAKNTQQKGRTLLLAPPSISAHPEALDQVFESHDRSVTDIQMLDRLALGLVSLPPDTYELVLILADANGAKTESQRLVGRDVLPKVFSALKAGGILRSQTGQVDSLESSVKTEAILAGFIAGTDGMVKPDTLDEEIVPLRFGKKTNLSTNAAPAVSLPLNGKRKNAPLDTTPVGVGFVDFTDDFGEPLITGEDDELIDEDDLLTEEDKLGPIKIPDECKPKVGKRRRACKDCTCGLKERIEAEDAAKRSAADESLKTMKLESDDLAEIDFTVQGKVGSCGNCALGDAFRCDGCPYIGLPAFKPGEEVMLLNNDIQL